MELSLLGGGGARLGGVGLARLGVGLARLRVGLARLRGQGSARSSSNLILTLLLLLLAANLPKVAIAAVPANASISRQVRQGSNLVIPDFPDAVFNLFLELEVPLAMGETNPLFNLILDLFLINPMPVRGMKFDQAIFTRQEAFERMETSIARLGLDGESCVLRLLCEVNAKPPADAGLLGDIINLVFRGDPYEGVSSDKSLRRDYRQAQELGSRGDCWQLQRGCPLSLFNMPFFHSP